RPHDRVRLAGRVRRVGVRRPTRRAREDGGQRDDGPGQTDHSSAHRVPPVEVWGGYSAAPEPVKRPGPTPSMLRQSGQAVRRDRIPETAITTSAAMITAVRNWPIQPTSRKSFATMPPSREPAMPKSAVSNTVRSWRPETTRRASPPISNPTRPYQTSDHTTERANPSTPNPNASSSTITIRAISAADMAALYRQDRILPILSARSAAMSRSFETLLAVCPRRALALPTALETAMMSIPSPVRGSPNGSVLWCLRRRTMPPAIPTAVAPTARAGFARSMPWTRVPPMLFRLPARPSGAEPELPFRRNAPFPDAPPGRDEPFRAALVVRDVVRLGEAVRVADDVRRFWLVVRLPDVVRSVAVFRFGLAVARDDRPFVWAPDPDALVFRRVVDLEFLVVAIDSPILKAFD